MAIDINNVTIDPVKQTDIQNLSCEILKDQLILIGSQSDLNPNTLLGAIQLKLNELRNSPADLRQEWEEKKVILLNNQAIYSQVYNAKGCATVIINPSTKPIISVTGVDFGDLEIGKSTTLPIKIENKGDDVLEIIGYSNFTNPQFSQDAFPTMTPDTPFVIEVGRTENVLVTFKPTGVYPINETIRFITTATGTNTAVVKGNGIPVIDAGIESILGKKRTNSKRILTIKNVREVSLRTKNNSDINSPYFDNQVTTHRAKIVADIYQYYTPFGQDKQIENKLLENVVIAEGVGSFWFERCDDFLGGLKPSYQYYYDMAEITDISSWKTLIKEEYSIDAVAGFGQGQIGISQTDFNSSFAFKQKVLKIKEEIETDNSFWGVFNATSPQEVSKQPGQLSTSAYLSSVISTIAKLTKKQNVKIYGGFKENLQTRSQSITDQKQPDLISSVQGNTVNQLKDVFISNVAYGRLNCLQPRTGCFITDEMPLEQFQTSGYEVVKLLSKSSLPEKIPGHACYRGYKATYIRGLTWQRRWEVMLDCLGDVKPEYEWRIDENLFNERGQTFDVWEDVEFAGTEIGFSETCLPMEIPKVQEPYVDMSDNLGCFELQTTKIYMKYPDYNFPGDRDYIRGPESLSQEDYSGIGPGIKLNRKVKRADCDDSPVRVFHPLKIGSDIITGRDNIISNGLFNGSQSPSSYHTSSLQSESSKKYIYNIVDETVTKNGKPISYFSVAYGNKNGSGSVYSGYETSDSTTKAIYSQTRLLALETSESVFKTYTTGSITSGRNDIYLINFNRDSLSDRIDAGNFQISLKTLDTSSSEVMTFIDNSSDILEDKFSNSYVYSYFDIVSGSLESGIHNSGTGSISTNPQITTYGKVFPSLGLIVFDAQKLDENLSFATDLSSNVDTNNALKLFTSISGAAHLNYHVKARSSYHKKSNHYFVRVSAGTSNYSNNPTMVAERINFSDSIDNKIKHEFFKHNPVTYITTVGLYNDAEELLAVAKLSKPVKKTPENDILIKIRLNW